MIKPFASLMAIFNPDTYDYTVLDKNTGGKDFDGQYIFQKVIPISEVAGFRGIEGAKRYVKIEGSYAFNGKHYFVLADKFDTYIGFTFVSAIPSEATEGGIAIYYTKTEKNEDPMSRFVVPMSIITIALIVACFIGTKVGNVLAFFQ